MRDPQELLQRAVALHNEHRWQEAEDCYRAALLASPTDAQARYLLGRLLLDSERFHEAATVLRQATALRSTYVEAWRDLGCAELESGRIDRGLKALEQAAALDPDDTHTLFTLGAAYHRSDDASRAAATLEAILHIRPDCEEALTNLVSLTLHRHQYEELVEYARRLLELRQNDESVRISMVLGLNALGRYEESFGTYRAAVQRNPENAELHLLLGQALLRAGRFREGWPEFQWWLKTTEYCAAPTPGPVWSGEPMAGERLVVVPDKGFGDTFQFLRFIGRLREQSGATIVLQCIRSVERLARLARGVDEVWVADSDGSVTHYDRWVGLTALPYLLNVGLEDLPAECPYLFAPPDLIEVWRARLDGYRGLRVGLRWRGNTSHLAYRSCELSDMSPLARVEGVTFFSLHDNAAELDAAKSKDAPPIVDLGPFLTDFAETAAAILNLDLVITIDTSIAHLSGALGIPTWTALPCYADWRWMDRRSDCPWYPTMRLYRQATIDDFHGVFERMADDLRELERCRRADDESTRR